jgi:hypothetical protein
MTGGRVSLRWYDHKAYTVCVDGQETRAFIIAVYTGWELMIRPTGPLDPGPDYCRPFPRLADARDWLRTDRGRAWLGQIAQVQ